MRFIVVFFWATFFGILGQECLSQSTPRDKITQSTQWLAVTSNIKFHKKVGFAFDGQLRFVQDVENAQHFVRNGLDIYLTPKLSVVPIGYMYVWNFRYGKQPAVFANDEHRIWQQVFYKHSIKRLGVNHRLRLEERFIQTHNASTGEDEGFTNKQLRARYRALANIPLNHNKMEPKTFYISIWDEVFVSWGKSVTYHEPDQNRIFVGPGYQINKDVAVQGGFLSQMLIKSNGTKQENNIGVLLQLNYNLDFSCKTD